MKNKYMTQVVDIQTIKMIAQKKIEDLKTNT